MSIHLLVAFVGCVAAVAGTVMLALRLYRTPRIVLAAWALAVLGLAVALGAQALGAHGTFGPGTFRAMGLGAQVLAPLALCLGLAEVVGRTLAARFAARLTLPALALIAFVVLGTDPLSGVTFTSAWPPPSVYYQIIPNKLLEFGLGPVTAVIALIAIGLTVARTRRNAAWRPAAGPVYAAGMAALALALPAMSALLSSYAGLTIGFGTLFVLLCLAAVALTWLAGLRISRVEVAPLHEGAADPGAEEDGWDQQDWDQQESWGARYDETGGFQSPVLSDGEGVYRGNGLYRPDPGYDERGSYPDQYGPDQYGPDQYGPDQYGHDEAEPDHRYSRGEFGGEQVPRYAGQFGDTDYPRQAYADDSGYADPVPPAAAGGSWLPGRGGDRSAGEGAFPPPGTQAREQLFGQIAIYTLIEGRVDEFDQLTEQVVSQVRSQEPDTLVYIVHAVPSAPMQRILYEVYRDRAAYERHKLQPYIGQFEAARDPLVLATNVIELGLQQATVSPFPSIEDLFGEPGYDTSGFERPDYSDYGRPAGASDAPGTAR
ncbi:MAG: antibiotic biosynthesis monooxygenase [Streptosporangiaceae bacterium]